MARKRYSPEEKIRILREHLDNNVSVSELSEQYDLHPGMIRNWKKELFEGALDTFSSKHKNRKSKNSKESHLEKKVSSMQEVITELTTENVKLRKKYHGEI
ncbi:transposase [candidate division KSB1 bacterium]|nr:transposase [candidate division KSB1 bacterium]